MALNKKTTNEFGVISSHDGKGNFSNNYNEQSADQRAAMFKSYDNDDNSTPAAATTQMASVVNAALGKTNPKTWDEFTAGKDLDSLSDAQWEKQYDNYYNYLDDDKFGLFTPGIISGTKSAGVAHNELLSGAGGVGSSYTQGSFGGGIGTYRDTASKEAAEQAKYDNSSFATSFDDWIKLEANEGLKDADYVTQREAYKNDPVLQKTTLNPTSSMFRKQVPDNVKLKTFEDYDPGLYTAGDDYGQFAGGYRTQDEADTKFQGYYTGELDKLGYGNLATEGLGNAGYISALEEATNRKGIADQITGLGYGSMVNPNMTADQLNAAFGEATERNKFKDLLDGMGTSYGDMDSSSSLGSLYDTTSKLNAADQKAAGLTTELGLLNTDFDALSTDYGTLQDTYGAAQAASQQQQGMAAANAAAANKAQRQNVGIASIPGPSASPYTAAAAPTGTTALQANPYQMAPIDFTGGLAGAGDDGTVRQTNIFAPPPMSMTQNSFDLNQSFNPYFDALNTQYGIPPVGGNT